MKQPNVSIHVYLNNVIHMEIEDIRVSFHTCNKDAFGNTTDGYTVLEPSDYKESRKFWDLWKTHKKVIKEIGISVCWLNSGPHGGNYQIEYRGTHERKANPE